MTEEGNDRICAQHRGYSGPKIVAVIQHQGGSDSGAVWKQRLQVVNIYRTFEGLVIEVI